MFKNYVQPLLRMDYRREVKRKAFHQLALLIPIGYAIFPKTTLLWIVIPITYIVIGVEIVRFHIPAVQKLFMRIFGILLRDREFDKFTGSSYLLVGAIITIWLFPKPYALLSLLFLIISDACAALVGKRFGKHKIFNKSWEGTAAFFISSVAISLFFPNLPLPQRITAVITATLIELLPLQIDDNLLIPLGSGGIIWVFFHPW